MRKRGVIVESNATIFWILSNFLSTDNLDLCLLFANFQELRLLCHHYWFFFIRHQYNNIIDAISTHNTYTNIVTFVTPDVDSWSTQLLTLWYLCHHVSKLSTIKIFRYCNSNTYIVIFIMSDVNYIHMLHIGYGNYTVNYFYFDWFTSFTFHVNLAFW